MSIQEIFNYYSIKNQFLCLSSSQILDLVQTEKAQLTMCKTLCQIIEKEDFFLMSEDLTDKLLDVICALRFRHYGNKPLFAMDEYITQQAREYQQLDSLERIKRRSIWLREEGKRHELLFSKTLGNTVEEVFTAVEWDPYHLKIIFEQNNQAKIENPTYFIATINLLLHDYPQVFKDHHEYREFAIKKLKELEQARKTEPNYPIDWVLRKTKKITNHLETLEHEKKLRYFLRY